MKPESSNETIYPYIVSTPEQSLLIPQTKDLKVQENKKTHKSLSFPFLRMFIFVGGGLLLSGIFSLFSARPVHAASSSSSTHVNISANLRPSSSPEVLKSKSSSSSGIHNVSPVRSNISGQSSLLQSREIEQPSSVTTRGGYSQPIIPRGHPKIEKLHFSQSQALSGIPLVAQQPTERQSATPSITQAKKQIGPADGIPLLEPALKKVSKTTKKLFKKDSVKLSMPKVIKEVYIKVIYTETSNALIDCCLKPKQELEKLESGLSCLCNYEGVTDS